MSNELHVEVDNQKLWISPGAYVSMEGAVEAHVEWEELTHSEDKELMNVVEQFEKLLTATVQSKRFKRRRKEPAVS